MSNLARHLFCLIGINLRAVVMTSEVNDLLLTITQSLARIHACALSSEHVYSIHRCKHVLTNTFLQGCTHAQSPACMRTHLPKYARRDTINLFYV